MDSFKRVKVEFAIKEIPNVGSRSFIDTLHFQPSHDVIFLQDAVRNKLQVVGCEGCDFEILMGEYYVDNSYFDELIEELFAAPARKQPQPVTATNNGGGGILLGIGGKSQQQQQQQDDGNNNDSSASSPLRWKFDVTVKAKRLTRDVLQRMMQQGSGMMENNNSPTTMTTSYPVPPQPSVQVEAVPIGSLSYTLTRGKYRVEGRVRSVRKKTANISEVELVDLHLQHNVITAITFSQICADRLAALKPNTCYEFKNIQCSQKNARDQQYSSNGHTMKIIVDDSSEVRPIPDPVTNYATDHQITTIIGGKTSRDLGGVNGYVPGAMATPFPTMTLLTRNNNSGDMLDTSSSSAAYTTSDRAPLTSTTTSSSSLGGRGFLGSSQNGGVMARPPQPRVTLLQRPPSSIATGSTATSGMRSGGTTTTTLLRAPGASSYASPASPTTTAHHQQVEEPCPVTSRDTQLLLEIAAEEAEAEELKRRRTEASPQCILCGHNLACEADRKEIQRRRAVWCKSMAPSEPLVYEDLRAEMRDKRSQIPGYKSEQYRMYCRAQFRHPLSKELHKVHCRCAHLACDYQTGSDMATTVLNASMAECNLCGEVGATVACLHPDCKKRYHTLCAVLSNGHVDFDQRDPYLPKPACPTHTNPGVKRRRPVLLRWDMDTMDTSVGTAAFDSAIVNRYDLRDPDDDSRA